MNALLTILVLGIGMAVSLFVPDYGPSAVLISLVFAVAVGLAIYRVKEHRHFLLQIFIAGLLIRMIIGTVIFIANLQEFFGGDALTYDYFGYALLKLWQGEKYYQTVVGLFTEGSGWGMIYIVAAIYSVVGRNPLAIQSFNAVIGAATAPVIFLCAHYIFGNVRVARIAAFFTAFYPSIVLWSSQGLKDALIVFLLAISMFATLKLGEKLNVKYFLLLVSALFAILSLRFYVFYMVTAAIAGAFIIGMRQLTTQSLLQQIVIIIGIGLAMTYLGILRTASTHLEKFGTLERVHVSRLDLAQTATSGFGKDVDISTTSGALSTIPIGMLYLLFAPFPWQLANLRQSITLPEMIVWWASFPFLILGLWFTLKYRLRQALPILIFTTMLTLSYSIFQGNVGTAYRQRSQILVFYFIFIAVGLVLLKERRENRKQQALLEKQLEIARIRGTSQNV